MLLVQALLDGERDAQADLPGVDRAVLDHGTDAGDVRPADALDRGCGARDGEPDGVLDRVGGRAGERDRLLDHGDLRSLISPGSESLCKVWHAACAGSSRSSCSRSLYRPHGRGSIQIVPDDTPSAPP